MKTTPILSKVAAPSEKPSSSRLLIGLLLIIAGFNIGVYNTGFGMGFGVFQALAAMGVFFALPRQKMTLLSAGLAAVSIASGLLIGLRDNFFVQGMCLAVSGASLGALMLIASLPAAPETIWQWISAQIKYLLFSIFAPFHFLQNMSDRQDTIKEKSGWLNPYQIIKTAILSMIVFGVFSALLMAADPIFKQIIESVMKQAVGRIIWSLFIAAVFASLLAISLPKQEEKYPQLRFLSIADVVVPIVVLVALFGGFLFIQGKYLFASHEVFQQFNITYSEYVRKGFTELLTAAGFATLLSYLLILKKRATGKVYLTWLNVILLIELALLLASAWKRDLMYIDVYGLTRMRIIGEVFLFWLGGNLALLFFLATWKRMEEKYVLAGAALCSLAALGYFTLVNMDMRIVSVAPKRENVKDLFYLANLSADAAPAWEELVVSAEGLFEGIKDKKQLDDTDKSRLANAKLAMLSLVAQRERLDKKFGGWERVKKTYRDDNTLKMFEDPSNISMRQPDPDHKIIDAYLSEQRVWQAHTLSEKRAYQLMDAKRDTYFHRVDVLLWSIKMYQKNNRINLYEQERWILYDFKYPFVDLKITYRPRYDEYHVPTPTPTPSGVRFR